MANWRVLTTINPDILGVVPRVDVVLPSKAAARAIAVTEKIKPGVTKTSVHLCPHAAGEPASEWYDCKLDPRAQYEEL